MPKSAKQFLFLVIFLSGFLLCQSVKAACTGSSPTWTAADCSSEEVSACITAASSGDTINIPADECTWTSGITVPDAKKIIIQGAGMDSTLINHGGTVTPLKAGTLGGDITGLRITGIGFIQDATIGSSTPSIDIKGSGWRIDHCRITNNAGVSRYSIIAHGTNVDNPPIGLIDNNDFVEGRVDIQGMGTFLKNSNIWSEESVLGTADMVYVEDNTFYKTVSGGGNSIDSNRAGSYAARYNTSTGIPQFMIHSLQADDERSPKNWEVYGNTFTTASSYNGALFFRGGTGIIFGNAMSGYHNNEIKFDNVRDGTSVGVFGLCNGSSYADGNIDSNGWPCRDQIGRGPDAFVWTSNTIDPSPAQESQPAYIWLNRNGASVAGILIPSASSGHIQADRDFYNESASFNGTSGVGYGALANRPATCTAGVSYWATNDNYSNLTEYQGASHTKNFSGTLYKCTATNTWTNYWIPYTYPHPLRTESSDTTAPASPTGLAVT